VDYINFFGAIWVLFVLNHDFKTDAGTTPSNGAKSNINTRASKEHQIQCQNCIFFSANKLQN
jgi:hypothetical protein